MRKRGDNIKFLANYIFKNPGCTSQEARKALCENNGKKWTTPTEMRGQYTTYFTTGWIGPSWRYNPCGRYWKRVNGRYVLTWEGLLKVDV